VDVTATSTPQLPGPPTIIWEKIDRSADGFKVEMPSGVQETQVPSYNEHGGEEPVQMIYANPSSETTFSVALGR